MQKSVVSHAMDTEQLLALMTHLSNGIVLQQKNLMTYMKKNDAEKEMLVKQLATAGSEINTLRREQAELNSKQAEDMRTLSEAFEKGKEEDETRRLQGIADGNSDLRSLTDDVRSLVAQGAGTEARLREEAERSTNLEELCEGLRTDVHELQDAAEHTAETLEHMASQTEALAAGKTPEQLARDEEQRRRRASMDGKRSEKAAAAELEKQAAMARERRELQEAIEGALSSKLTAAMTTVVQREVYFSEGRGLLAGAAADRLRLAAPAAEWDFAESLQDVSAGGCMHLQAQGDAALVKGLGLRLRAGGRCSSVPGRLCAGLGLSLAGGRGGGGGGGGGGGDDDSRGYTIELLVRVAGAPMPRQPTAKWPPAEGGDDAATASDGPFDALPLLRLTESGGGGDSGCVGGVVLTRGPADMQPMGVGAARVMAALAGYLQEHKSAGRQLGTHALARLLVEHQWARDGTDSEFEAQARAAAGSEEVAAERAAAGIGDNASAEMQKEFAGRKQAEAEAGREAKQAAAAASLATVSCDALQGTLLGLEAALGVALADVCAFVEHWGEDTVVAVKRLQQELTSGASLDGSSASGGDGGSGWAQWGVFGSGPPVERATGGGDGAGALLQFHTPARAAKKGELWTELKCGAPGEQQGETRWVHLCASVGADGMTTVYTDGSLYGQRQAAPGGASELEQMCHVAFGFGAPPPAKGDVGEGGAAKDGADAGADADAGHATTAPMTDDDQEERGEREGGEGVSSDADADAKPEPEPQPEPCTLWLRSARVFSAALPAAAVRERALAARARLQAEADQRAESERAAGGVQRRLDSLGDTLAKLRADCLADAQREMQKMAGALAGTGGGGGGGGGDQEALWALERTISDQFDGVKAKLKELEKGVRDAAAAKGLAADMKEVEAQVMQLVAQQAELSSSVEGLKAKGDGGSSAEDLAAIKARADAQQAELLALDSKIEGADGANRKSGKAFDEQLATAMQASLESVGKVLAEQDELTKKMERIQAKAAYVDSALAEKADDTRVKVLCRSKVELEAFEAQSDLITALQHKLDTLSESVHDNCLNARTAQHTAARKLNELETDFRRRLKDAKATAGSARDPNAAADGFTLDGALTTAKCVACHRPVPSTKTLDATSGLLPPQPSTFGAGSLTMAPNASPFPVVRQGFVTRGGFRIPHAVGQDGSVRLGADSGRPLTTGSPGAPQGGTVSLTFNPSNSAPLLPGGVHGDGGYHKLRY
jgi:hypothetical protein